MNVHNFGGIEIFFNFIEKIKDDTRSGMTKKHSVIFWRIYLKEK